MPHLSQACGSTAAFELGNERVTLEVEGFGTIVLGFFPNAAPVMIAHIVQALQARVLRHESHLQGGQGLCCSNTVREPVFRAAGSVRGNASRSRRRRCPEVTDIKHVRGILSMGRMSDPNSGGSSFSMLLGRAAHLDQQYTVFGKVLSGMDVLASAARSDPRVEGFRRARPAVGRTGLCG